MSHDADHRIRERAYHLWEAAGRPHGRDHEFWVEASRLEREGAAAPAKKASAAKGKPAGKPAAAKAKPAEPAKPAPKPKRASPKK